MAKRTLKQIDREIRRLEKRLGELRADRELIKLGIEPRNQLSIFALPVPSPPPRRPKPTQLLLI